MQGLVAVCLIVDAISNVNVKIVSHCSPVCRSRSPGQESC